MKVTAISEIALGEYVSRKLEGPGLNAEDHQQQSMNREKEPITVQERVPIGKREVRRERIPRRKSSCQGLRAEWVRCSSERVSFPKHSVCNTQLLPVLKLFISHAFQPMYCIFLCRISYIFLKKGKICFIKTFLRGLVK